MAMDQAITLPQLLASREDRWHRQMELVRDNPGLTLVCLTVVMPGSVKRTAASAVVARAAMDALRDEFGTSIRQCMERDLVTGFEAFVLVDRRPDETKRLTCLIEDSHPLGRLFDMDVIDASATPLSRTALGFSPRRCLLCGAEARYCMRNGTHTLSEIQAHINEMIDGYVHRL